MTEQVHASDGSPAGACSRQPLVDAITTFLAYRHAPNLPEIRAVLERTIDEAGPGAVDALSRGLACAGQEWSYSPRDPLARKIHYALAELVLREPPVVAGEAPVFQSLLRDDQDAAEQWSVERGGRHEPSRRRARGAHAAAAGRRGEVPGRARYDGAANGHHRY